MAYDGNGLGSWCSERFSPLSGFECLQQYEHSMLHSFSVNSPFFPLLSPIPNPLISRNSLPMEPFTLGEGAVPTSSGFTRASSELPLSSITPKSNTVFFQGDIDSDIIASLPLPPPTLCEVEVKPENATGGMQVKQEHGFLDVQVKQEHANEEKEKPIQSARNKEIRESAEEMKKKRRLEKNREMAKNCRRRKKEHKEAVLQEVLK